MANVEEIDKAIGAHGMWKARLKTVIETGKSDTPADTIRQDNRCTFGQWLYGATLTDADKASPHYQNVRQLHAEFHKVAARVVELATTGKKQEAQALMELGGEYSRVSGNLTKAMMDWKRSLN